MNLMEAGRILKDKGYRLLKESSTYTISKPGVRVDMGVNSYFANGVTATGELAAGCGGRGYDEFEIDPDSIIPTVEWWTDEGLRWRKPRKWFPHCATSWPALTGGNR